MNTSPRMKMTSVIAGDGQALSQELQALRQTLFPPVSQKVLRNFSSGEAARLIGIADGYLRQLSLGGKGPQCPRVEPAARDPARERAGEREKGHDRCEECHVLPGVHIGPKLGRIGL